MAIIGVLIVAQFQRPLDEQDAIRQVTKFCIFASGILITLSSVILACTNIPREIENRVIYTVVTKPTSRLEILMGKIAGFAARSRPSKRETPPPPSTGRRTRPPRLTSMERAAGAGSPGNP